MRPVKTAVRFRRYSFTQADHLPSVGSDIANEQYYRTELINHDLPQCDLSERAFGSNPFAHAGIRTCLERLPGRDDRSRVGEHMRLRLSRTAGARARP
jgi:hypothetical protein